LTRQGKNFLPEGRKERAPRSIPSCPENYFSCPGKTFAARERKEPTLPFVKQGKNFFAGRTEKHGTKNIYLGTENHVGDIYCASHIRKSFLQIFCNAHQKRIITEKEKEKKT
jgi:hypothetical protein